MGKITLKAILKDKSLEIKNRKARRPLRQLREEIRDALPVRNFRERITKGQLMAIAEIKKKSPSVGRITKLDTVSIAREYEKSIYCCAISVLTDKKYFGGDINSLKVVKSCTTKPILRKDFVIDEYQIYEARSYGADMILLISSILSKQKLSRFISLAVEIGLLPLVEVHTPEDIKKVPPEAEVYGINNRNLMSDFSTDINVSKKLLRYIPRKKIIIVESGLETRKDIAFIKSLKRVNAILIGTSILRQAHPGRALDRLFKNIH